MAGLSQDAKPTHRGDSIAVTRVRRRRRHYENSHLSDQHRCQDLERRHLIVTAVASLQRMLSERTEYSSNELKNPPKRGFNSHTEMDSGEFTPRSAVFFLHRQTAQSLGLQLRIRRRVLRSNSANIKTNYELQRAGTEAAPHIAPVRRVVVAIRVSNHRGSRSPATAAKNLVITKPRF